MKALAVAATVTLTAATLVAGTLDLGAVLGAPLRVMGSRVEAAESTAAEMETARAGASGAATVDVEPVSADGPDGRGIWAVVVGVDDYPGSGRDLRAAAADARDMDAMLGSFGVPVGRRQVLLDGAATRDAVSGALEWLAANAGPRSTAVVFFSGHVREVHGDPDGDGEEVDEVMVLADDGTITDGELAAVLDRTPARRAWVVMASCYGGGFDDVMAPGRVLTAAAPEGVLAYENDRFNRTYLVEYMVRRALLGGAAATSVQDAFAWALEEIRRDYPNRLPVISDQLGEPLVL